MATFYKPGDPSSVVNLTEDQLKPGLINQNDVGNRQRLINSGLIEGIFPTNTDQTKTTSASVSNGSNFTQNAAPKLPTNTLTSEAAQTDINDMTKFLTSRDEKLKQDQAALTEQTQRLKNEAQQRIQNEFQIKRNQLDRAQNEEDNSSAAIQFRLGREATPYAEEEKRKLNLAQTEQMDQLARDERDAIAASLSAIENGEYQKARQLQQEADTAFNQRMAIQQEQRQQKAAEFEQVYKAQSLVTQQQNQLFDQNQQLLQLQLNSNKFDYQQKQDSIQNALQQGKISFDQAQTLKDYNLKLQQLDQGKYIVSSDAFGRPVAFNTKTGQFENSALPTSNGSTDKGVYAPQNSAYLDAFRNASIGMNDKDQKSRLGQLNDLLQSGDTARAREQITRVATKNASTDQQNQALARTIAVNSLSEVKSLLDAYVQKTGDTSIIGSSIEKAAEKIGQTNDPALAAINTKIQLALQSYRKNMTGVAFSPAEAATYAAIFPDIMNANLLNTTKINSLIEAFNGQQKSFLGSQIGQSNYDQIFGNATHYSNLKELYLGKPELQSQIDQIKQQEPNLSDIDIMEIVYPSRPVNQPQGESGSGVGTVAESFEKQYPTDSKGGQCGVFAHQIVDFPNVGDGKNAKIASVYKFGIPAEEWRPQAQVGDVLITEENPTYGHVAVINKINGDGTATLTESNFHGNEKVTHTRKISLDNQKIVGAIRGNLKI